MNEELRQEGRNQDGILTLDVLEREKEIIIKSAIAGVSGKDLDIEITKDTVTIRGKRQEEETEKTKQYYYQELHWGSFSRTVILPEEVNSDEAKATLKNGVLTIILPKRQFASRLGPSQKN